MATTLHPGLPVSLIMRLSIHTLPPELQPIVTGYLNLPSLVALRKASWAFSPVQPIIDQRDGQRYPLRALPHAIRRDCIE